MHDWCCMNKNQISEYGDEEINNPGMIPVFNPIALRKAKIVFSFGLSECSRVKNTCCDPSFEASFLSSSNDG